MLAAASCTASMSCLVITFDCKGFGHVIMTANILRVTLLISFSVIVLGQKFSTCPTNSINFSKLFKEIPSNHGHEKAYLSSSMPLPWPYKEECEDPPEASCRISFFVKYISAISSSSSNRCSSSSLTYHSNMHQYVYFLPQEPTYDKTQRRDEWNFYGTVTSTGQRRLQDWKGHDEHFFSILHYMTINLSRMLAPNSKHLKHIG